MTAPARIGAGHMINPRTEKPEARAHTQWRVVDIPQSITRSEVTKLLSDQAEYGRWELAKSLVYIGGARRVWLRRRAMRVERTDAA